MFGGGAVGGKDWMRHVGGALTLALSGDIRRGRETQASPLAVSPWDALCQVMVHQEALTRLQHLFLGLLSLQN